MTILDDVARLIERLAPLPICSDCISDKLNLGARHHVDQKCRELAGTNGVERHKAACGMCNAIKLVVRKAR
ncbi:MAG: hypothetical protein JWR80_3194 [Bradyrhizobium sp.]|nr:hypothetical protein [Bradyrhizobium sp.]